MDTSPKPASGKSGLAFGLVGLLVGLVAGYGAGRVSTGTPVNPLVESKGGYEEGYAAAKKKLAESGLVPNVPTQTMVLSGVVVSADRNAVVFDAETFSPNPLEAPTAAKRRTARLTADTKIVRMEPLTAEEMASAQAAFQEALAAGRPGTPPPPTKAVPYADALKAGDTIVVEAASDIYESETFDAIAITVNAR